jgi:heme/copper-type cytochrome/quinol oxidase subunit 3
MGLVLGTALLIAPLLVAPLREMWGLLTLTAAGWQTVGILLGLLFLVTEVYKWVRLAMTGRSTGR